MQRTRFVIAFVAVTAIGTAGFAQNKPTTQPVPGSPVTQLQPASSTPPTPTQSPRTGATPAPAAQAGVLANQSPEDAALPAEKHHMHVALRHITIARNILKETKDGGDQRVEAKTKLNLAMNDLYKLLDLDRKIGADDKDAKAPAPEKDPYANRGSSVKADESLPKENRELHIAVRHLNIAKAVLAEGTAASEHRTDALGRVNEALQLVSQALAQGNKANAPSAKTD